ncbi:MAG: VWA domain-containing protein [Blastocatellia bacterium]|nr:VWA domain-containing protein [Blastocatellia bacterium]
MFRSVLRQFLRFVLYLLLVGSLQAQTSQTTNDSQETSIKLRADLVVIDAQVIDKRSREFIRGLKAQDFDLFEDEAGQRIEFLSQGELPLSIVLLVDVSPSVRPVIEKIREGALQSLTRLNPEDEVALMAFSGWTELIQDFTRDRQLILDKLGEALEKKGSGTRIHEAIARAARQMRYVTNPKGRRAIIVITDNQGSMDRYRDAISEEEVRQTVMESGATVCGIVVRSLLNVADAIIFQHPEIQERSKRTSVNPYAEQTGGEIGGAGKDEINARLGEMLDHLRSRYGLGYFSTNQNYNGKFRRIELKLSADARKRLGKGIVISTRQGYYAIDSESEALLAEDDPPEEKNPDNRTQPLTDPSPSSVSAAEPKGAAASPDKLAVPPDAELLVSEPPQPVSPPHPYSHLVMLDLHAINRKTGAVADNLVSEDFELYDNGSKKEIIHFSRGELPLSVVLLIDVGGKTPYVMSSLRRSIAQWLRLLGPDDEIALMGFGGSAALIQGFTKDRKLIAAGIRDFADTARQKGVGNGQDRTVAVFHAAEYMDKAANPISRRVIITITDDSPRSYTTAESGATARVLLDSRSVVYAMVTKGPRPSRKRQVITSAAEGALYGLGNPISIAIHIFTKMGSRALLDAILKDRAFGQMIQKTGGAAVKIDGEDATENLVFLLDQIKKRYVVGIIAPDAPTVTPSDAAAQDSFHTLKLKLTSEGLKRHGELTVTTSQGYYLRVAEPSEDSDVANDAGKPAPKNPR